MKPLLYDFERDGDIKEGEALIVYVDGTTKRMAESKLFPKEGGQREPKHIIRSRPARTAEHRKTHTRQVAPRKRSAVCKAR